METGLENLHLFFSHLGTIYGRRLGRNEHYPDDLWDTEGAEWVKLYRKSLSL